MNRYVQNIKSSSRFYCDGDDDKYIYSNVLHYIRTYLYINVSVTFLAFQRRIDHFCKSVVEDTKLNPNLKCYQFITPTEKYEHKHTTENI